MEPLKVIVIGAGGRGQRYTDIMGENPTVFQVVGVAEPISERRDYIREKHAVPQENCYTTWEHILDRPRFADVAIISTMDRMHYEPAMKAIELGYHLLLEKPVAPTAEECAAIYHHAEKHNVKIMVCHVLRYTPFFMQLKKILRDGVVGDVVSVEHIEAVGHIHQSHSFVRGNWGNADESSAMLLQKCCHDLDILQWLLEKDCKKIQSFGSLKHFRPENAPEGAPDYCVEGCPHADTCYYNATKLYFDDKNNSWFRSAATTKPDPTDEDVMEALKTTQYGKCVYKCNNNVVDHQVVNMVFDGDITVNMTMCAFTKGGRKTHIMGTKGELTATMSGKDNDWFSFFDFATRKTRSIEAKIDVAGDSIVSGHGGGDAGIIDALKKYLSGELKAEEVSEIGISCKNHMLVFAAEESRLTDQVIRVEDFVKKYM